MSTIRARFSTTHLDLDNQKFSLGALESMAEQINNGIIPYGVEHDPRIPPIGRIIQAEVNSLEDGEHALDGTVELFDGDFSILMNTGEREIPIRKYNNGKLTIVFDKSFGDEKSKKDLEELQRILQTGSIEEDMKKSTVPISVLVIGGGFILGAIANGFFGQIGADAYLMLKKKLSEIYSGSLKVGEEKLLVFASTIAKENKSINVEVIITNPTSKDIQIFFDEGIKELDQILPRHFENDHGFSKIVFEYESGYLKVKFAVLKNGIPILPNELHRNS